ncbi:DUF4834 family protein [Porphyromonadaceae bacterium W3.11]|nr:DUF4834 family protein [Porphyromonadaceae bacterium W3.11]
MYFFLLIILLPIILVAYLLIKNWRLVRAAYKINQTQKAQKKQYQEEQERSERVRKRTRPEQSSVELINDAHLDLEGGEYVDYEEVK